MKQKIVLQGLAPNGGSLFDELKHWASQNVFDRLDVAVAYATLDGVKALYEALNGIPVQTRWVVGLDDAVTQPGAIERIKAFDGSRLKVISFASQNRRFHPKFYRLWSSTDAALSYLVVGSGNLTSYGLKRNGEAFSILEAESDLDVIEHDAAWDMLEAASIEPTDAIIADYKTKYAKAKDARKQIADAGAAPSEPAPAQPGAPLFQHPALEVDLTVTAWAWLDIGSATAQGREIELPRDMTPYFGISPTTGATRTCEFTLPNNAKMQIVLTYREDNAMWRIPMPAAAIQSLVGRPTFRPAVGGNRSPEAITFKRIGKRQFKVQAVPINGPEYLQLQNASLAVNGLARTSTSENGRNYGFF